MHIYTVAASIFLFAASIKIVNATTIPKLTAKNYALAELIDGFDSAVVAMTVDSSVEDAEETITNIANLTTSLFQTAAIDTSSPTPPTADETEEDEIRESYGLFTNTLEEFMIDMVDMQPVLGGRFGLGQRIIAGVAKFNGTFTEYSGYIHRTVVDTYHKNLTMNMTHNAVYGINNVTMTYSTLLGRAWLDLEDVDVVEGLAWPN